MTEKGEVRTRLIRLTAKAIARSLDVVCMLPVRGHSKAVRGNQPAQHFDHAAAEGVDSGSSVFMLQIAMQNIAVTAGCD